MLESDSKYSDEVNHLEAAKAYRKKAQAVAQLTMAFTNKNSDCLAFACKAMTTE